MKDGAWGMATGLIYTPGTYSKTDELVALAKVAAKHGASTPATSAHEDTGLLEAIEEALHDRPGGEAAGPHLAHQGERQAGLGQVGRRHRPHPQGPARTGRSVTADQYPYVASSTSLAATLVPTRFRDGTAEGVQGPARRPGEGPADPQGGRSGARAAATAERAS